jgi:nitrate/nitrite transporter NarK
MLPIRIAGLPVAGYIFDRTGSYTLAFQIFIGVYACAAVALLFVHKSDVDQRIKRTLPTKRDMGTVKEF